MCTGCIIDQEDNFKAAAQQQQFGSTGGKVNVLRHHSFLERLKNERNGLLRELGKVQSKIDLLERQPQDILDTIDEVTKY